MNMNSRESFEARVHDLNLDRYEDGYADVTTDMLWCTWQAAIKYCESQKPENDKQTNLLSTNETLRDKFAMAALPSIFSDFAHHGALGYDDSFSAMAEAAYALADAMLKEREK